MYTSLNPFDNTTGQARGEYVPTRPEVFSGWKQIANYLGKGVRTVQRYERQMKLPIHRAGGKSRGAVIATRAELDAWITGRLPEARKLLPSSRTNSLGAQFLQIDSDTALTFAAIALSTTDENKRGRSAQTARNAYDAIVRLRSGIALSDTQREKLDSNLDRLKAELRMLGHAV